MERHKNSARIGGNRKFTPLQPTTMAKKKNSKTTTVKGKAAKEKGMSKTVTPPTTRSKRSTASATTKAVDATNSASIEPAKSSAHLNGMFLL